MEQSSISSTSGCSSRHSSFYVNGQRILISEKREPLLPRRLNGIFNWHIFLDCSILLKNIEARIIIIIILVYHNNSLNSIIILPFIYLTMSYSHLLILLVILLSSLIQICHLRNISPLFLNHASSFRDLRRIRNTIDQTTTCTIATSLIHSKIDYCNSLNQSTCYTNESSSTCS